MNSYRSNATNNRNTYNYNKSQNNQPNHNNYQTHSNSSQNELSNSGSRTRQNTEPMEIDNIQQANFIEPPQKNQLPLIYITLDNQSKP